MSVKGAADGNPYTKPTPGGKTGGSLTAFAHPSSSSSSKAGTKPPAVSSKDKPASKASGSGHRAESDLERMMAQTGDDFGCTSGSPRKMPKKDAVARDEGKKKDGGAAALWGGRRE